MPFDKVILRKRLVEMIPGGSQKERGVDGDPQEPLVISFPMMKWRISWELSIPFWEYKKKRHWSLHYQMYQKSLGGTEKEGVPGPLYLGQSHQEGMTRSQKRKPFSRALKQTFSFAEEEALVWNKSPRLDAAFSQVSRHTDLAFEEMGALSYPMDIRMDLLLKSWDSSQGNLKPAMAVTVVASNIEYWLTQIRALVAGTPKETILSLPRAI